MSDTLAYQSNIGQRLEKIKKSEIMKLTYEGKFYPIAAKLSIGRSKDNDIVINDSLTSRNHAIIQKIKDAYFIKDLNSTNGTYVNEQLLPNNKYLKLYCNDVVKIGRTNITIK